MTTTTAERGIADMLWNRLKAAITKEIETKQALATACTEGGKLPLTDYMNAVLTAEADAAPWDYAKDAIDHYGCLDESGAQPIHVIKGVRAAYEHYMIQLVKNGPAPYTSSPMTNYAEQLKHEGIRKFVAEVGPLLDYVK